MKLLKVNDVYQLSDSDVKYLNSLNSVQDFPKELNPPTLNKKVSIVERTETGGRSAMANSTILKGEIICLNDNAKISKPINYSWQLDKDVHAIGLGALDHNCQNPTCGLDDNNNFVALKDIKKSEYITFNYLTTEYDLNSPFKCKCGEDKCFKNIKGFKYLTTKQQKELLHNFTVSKYIKSLIN